MKGGEKGLTNSELKHHGILGQRWGIRRFQNKDGSLTSAGRKRYNVDEDGKKESAPKDRRLTERQKKQESDRDIYNGNKSYCFNSTRMLWHQMPLLFEIMQYRSQHSLKIGCAFFF